MAVAVAVAVAVVVVVVAAAAAVVVVLVVVVADIVVVFCAAHQPALTLVLYATATVPTVQVTWGPAGYLGCQDSSHHSGFGSSDRLIRAPNAKPVGFGIRV